MSEDDNEVEPLIFLQFHLGTAKYNENFTIETTGSLWPRDLRVLNQIIEIYKENNKQDPKTPKSEYL